MNEPWYRRLAAWDFFPARAQAAAPLALPVSGELLRLGEVQRRLQIYLHALWECDFVIQAISKTQESRSDAPFLSRAVIHLPAHYYDLRWMDGRQVSAMDSYRAAAAHAAAHLIYSPHFTQQSLDKWQRAVIATIEDARVEALAMRRFPGLKQLWAIHHRATPADNQTAGDYLNRLARALLDETYQDDDAWIVQGRQLCAALADDSERDVALHIGLTLAQTFQTKGIRYRSKSDCTQARYRDDHRCLWEVPPLAVTQQQELPSAFFNVKLLLTSDKVVHSDEHQPPPGTHAIKEVAAADTYRYSEWDYRSQIDTPVWVTLRERTSACGEVQTIAAIYEQHRHVIARMNKLLQAIRHQGAHRIRKLEEGDEIDLNAAINTQIDLRSGRQPDPRIMMRSTRKNNDIAALILLDLSSSMNQKVYGHEHTGLELAQQVSVLFGETLQAVGDPFAIHGFCSKTRHDVEYFRIKDFDQPYDDAAKARIAGMTGQRATRIGAAIRHATFYLDQQLSRKKLLMIITDGEPADFDMQDPKYLRADTKYAIKAAQRHGIHTYCVGLDPQADQYVPRLFGLRNYMVVDHVRCLPEKMLMIYAALTL